ncbi:hypothetical protein LTR85_003492 [Meristemomyces frigidus]|nr:hypothetical protein LTR85_003492 [Meristemomyces frigidus]
MDRDPYDPYGDAPCPISNRPWTGLEPMDTPLEGPMSRLADAPPWLAEEMMGEPTNPGRFADQLSGFLTPPLGPSRPVSGAFAYDDPGIDRGPRTPTLFSDDVVHGFANERGLDLPRREIYEDEFLGSRKGHNFSDELAGAWTDDYIQRLSLLNEPLPDIMIPTARTTMPEMRKGSALERTFPGHKDSMPEGAIGYVGRDEVMSWGNGGPTMYPSEVVDDEFIRNREADPDWSPPDIYEGDRYRWH